MKKEESGIQNKARSTRNPIVFLILNTFCLILFPSCANIVAPTGGDKDSQPPVFLSAEPDTNSVNFSDNKIRLNFDEYVDLNNIQNQLIISPDLQPKPKVTVSGKSVLVDLKKDTLRPNTTYAFQFGSGIKDYTEGNILKDFRYVFSTGNTIDTNKFIGKTYDSQTGSPLAEAWVLLYINGSDSSLLNERPYYLAQSGPDGSFKMLNLAPGKYRAFALMDKNTNFKWDLGEKAGFLEHEIEIPSTEDKKIYLFDQPAPKTELIDVMNPLAGKYVFVFNNPIKTFYCEGSIKGDSVITELSKTKDTLFYFTGAASTAKQVFYYEINGGKRDSFSVQYPKSVRDSADNKASAANFVYRNQYTATGKSFSVNQTKVNPADPFVLHFTRPIQKIDLSRMAVLQDSQKLAPNFNVVFLNKSKTSVRLGESTSPGENYNMVFPKGSFTDYNGIENSEFELSFTTEKKENLCSVSVVFLSDTTRGLLVLKDKTGNAIYSAKIDEAFLADKSGQKIKNLLSGEFSFYLVKDENKNGKWDTGNVFQNKQAEKVIKLREKVFIKPGWEYTLEVK